MLKHLIFFKNNPNYKNNTRISMFEQGFSCFKKLELNSDASTSTLILPQYIADNHKVNFCFSSRGLLVFKLFKLCKTLKLFIKDF